MKRYPDLSNTKRARILCQLFPVEIPLVLDFIARKTADLLADPAAFKDQYDERLFGFDRWLALSKEVRNLLDQRQRKEQEKLFISLFDGFPACYSGQLLILYCKEIKSKDSRFAIAVRLLFMV
jgi:hypothetical protein